MQIAWLVTEAGLAGGLVLFLFWLRPRIGLAPLYLVVGAFQYLQLVLAAAVRVDVVPGLTVGRRLRLAPLPPALRTRAHDDDPRRADRPVQSRLLR